MKAKTIIIASLFLGIVLYILFDYLINFLEEPKIEISKIEYPPLKISLKTSKINTITGVDFFKENEYIWSLVINKKIKKIIFGDSKEFKQIFPLKGEPRNLQPGEKFYICIGYQFDYFFAPSFGSKIWLIEIVNDKEIKMHGETKGILPFLPMK